MRPTILIAIGAGLVLVAQSHPGAQDPCTAAKSTYDTAQKHSIASSDRTAAAFRRWRGATAEAARLGKARTDAEQASAGTRVSWDATMAKLGACRDGNDKCVAETQAADAAGKAFQKVADHAQVAWKEWERALRTAEAARAAYLAEASAATASLDELQKATAQRLGCRDNAGR
jgi:hypothetical protein